jgi:hypothetical protein
VKVCEGFAWIEVAPSPKFQAYEATAPPGSAVPAELNPTEMGTSPLAGVAEATAIGQLLPPLPKISYPIR